MNYDDWLATVESSPDLNGGGTILAPVFLDILKGQHFHIAFEWCAGPAWIGLWLLENGICDELVTGDINEKSVGMVRTTAYNHNYNVRAYVSDNLNSIPDNERFDLVVSNPPNYFNIQRSHPFGYLRDDLRPSDIDWHIHKDFYQTIPDHLDGPMYISEVEPHEKEVWLEGSLYDVRDRTPMDDFREMTESNGLKIEGTFPYIMGNTNCSILRIVRSCGRY